MTEMQKKIIEVFEKFVIDLKSVAEILEWARHTCPGRMRRLANMGKRGVPTCA